MQQEHRPAKHVVLSKRYRLDRPLGRGGSGSVYQATDLLLNEPVCVKILHAQYLNDASARKRFVREMALARRISHSAICRMHDYHEDEGVRFLTMEYVEGISLRDAMGDGKRFIPAGRAIRILKHIAEAIAVIHEHGVIHRDLKAQNIMIRAPTDGQLGDQICIVDFGIAIADDLEGAPLTRPGIALGTRHYMAPELWQGKPATEQSDLFAVGVLAYMMLTMRLPWPDHEGSQHLKTMREVRPKPATQYRESLPFGVDIFFERALALEAAERFASAVEMSEAFQSLLNELEEDSIFDAKTQLLLPESISSGNFEMIESGQSESGASPEKREVGAAAASVLLATTQPLAVEAPPAATGISPTGPARENPVSALKETVSQAPSDAHLAVSNADSASWVIDGHPVDSLLRAQRTEELQTSGASGSSHGGGTQQAAVGGSVRGSRTTGLFVALLIVVGVALWMEGFQSGATAPENDVQEPVVAASPVEEEPDTAPTPPEPDEFPTEEVSPPATPAPPVARAQVDGTAPSLPAAPQAPSVADKTTNTTERPKRRPRGKARTTSQKASQQSFDKDMKKLRAAMKRKAIAPVDDDSLKSSIQSALAAQKRGAFEEAARHQEKALGRIDALVIDDAFVKRKLTRFNRAYDRVGDLALKKQLEQMGDKAAKALVARRYEEANNTLQKALLKMKNEGP